MLYRIKNLDKFIKATLQNICDINGYKQKDVKKYIDKNNVRSLLKKYIQTNTDKKIFISEKDISRLYRDIQEWIVGIELSKLAGADLINCYWDNDKNSMEFFHKK